MYVYVYIYIMKYPEINFKCGHSFLSSNNNLNITIMICVMQLTQYFTYKIEMENAFVISL